MRALCVGRHRFLSDHIGRFFGNFGLETASAVGFEGALAVARRVQPDVVICDYDLMATLPLDVWERDPVLSRTPVVAVSMTRRPDEGHLLDVNAIGGFLYLPTLTRDDAMLVLGAAAAAPRRQPYTTLRALDEGRQGRLQAPDAAPPR